MRASRAVATGLFLLVCYSLASFRDGASPASAQPTPGKVAEPANQWQLFDKAILGPDRPIAVVWSPEIKRFMSLGWISSQYDRRQPYTYDELAFDAESGQWENWYPKGKEWGPRFGVSKPPLWKGNATFKDQEGNVRPNWAGYYWLLGAGRNCVHLPDLGLFLFYVNGNTFCYDPVNRTWRDLAATGDPQSSTPLKRQLFWGSICYDEANKLVVLFGGGNSDTERGDPGTWTYDPARNTWQQLKLDRQPPPRANSQLAYDPVSKKVVLFGGDQLDQTVADTWVFDGVKWEEMRPAHSPSPRAGHALLWLPKAKKLLLLGGYSVSSTVGYSTPPYRKLPLEAWTYEVDSNVWKLVKQFEPAKTTPDVPVNRFLMATVGPEDQVALVDSNRKFGVCQFDVSQPDAEGAAKVGVKPGTVDRRTGPYDPAWYRDVPAPEVARIAADLKEHPANKWSLRPTPRRPAPNMDWGSAVFSPEFDLIMRFSGGHSAYSGTAPQVYDVRSDRWSIPFAPEMPIDWCFSNDQVPGEWSFKGNPWMTGHTYKATAYDPNLRSLVFGPHRYTYFFDPKSGTWTRNRHINPFRPDFYTVTMVPTPNGVVTWAYNTRDQKVGLWRLRAEDKTWQPLPLKGTLFGPSSDNSGMAYDSKRDAMLFFAREGKEGCATASYSFATGEVKALAPEGATKVQAVFREPNRGNSTNPIFREAVYLADLDLVMIGATGLIYDCGKNAWFRTALPSDAPAITRAGNYDIGVMYDPNRKLVWAVNANSQVFTLRFDPKTASIEALK